ncbi:MAG: DUF4391 domain-containing protein [Clostridiales bacterium]|nr:DUF4391 domain-containing protein [Clostridiales bacterium]
MDNLIIIPEKYKLKMNRAHDKQFMDRIYGDTSPDITDTIERFTWFACMKPALGEVIPRRSESIRYDELQIFHIKISDTQELFHICAPIYRAVPYPCLLIIQYKDKYAFSACKFSAGKDDYDQNVDRHLVVSHWLFPDSMSERALEFVGQINSIIFREGDLYVLYTSLFNTISNFSMAGISKAHVNQLVKDMLRKTITTKSFWAKLSQYKRYDVAGKGKSAQYQKRKNTYSYRCDTEDLWHTFLSDDRLHKVIVGRRYRDIEDLIRTIDSKYESEW